MIILGIDPGVGRVGFGIIEKLGSQLKPIHFGLIETNPGPLPQRLEVIYQETQNLLNTFQPHCMATERLLFTKNQTTAMDVAKALGCILLATAIHRTEHFEYSPPEIKLAVTGTGSANKSQVQFMVTKLLGLQKTPKPDDVADALAIAITHALKSTSIIQQEEAICYEGQVAKRS